MPVTTAQTLHDLYHPAPRREMPPDALCENADTFVTEDADNWIVNWFDSRKPPRLHSKKANYVYPLALVLKWGYRPVNVERLNEISKQDSEK